MSKAPVRIAPLDPPYEPDVQASFTALMPPGVPPLALFRTLAKNPRVLSRIRRAGLLDPGAITLRERELVILRSTALCGAEYEWGVHVRFFGARAGFDEAQLYATVHGASDDPVWSASERTIVHLCDALHAESALPDELWQALRASYGEAQLIELVTLAGFYHAISFIVNAFAIELEPEAARFPARLQT